MSATLEEVEMYISVVCLSCLSPQFMMMIKTGICRSLLCFSTLMMYRCLPVTRGATVVPRVFSKWRRCVCLLAPFRLLEKRKLLLSALATYIYIYIYILTCSSFFFFFRQSQSVHSNAEEEKKKNGRALIRPTHTQKKKRRQNPKTVWTHNEKQSTLDSFAALKGTAAWFVRTNGLNGAGGSEMFRRP